MIRTFYNKQVAASIKTNIYSSSTSKSTNTTTTATKNYHGILNDFHVKVWKRCLNTIQRETCRNYCKSMNHHPHRYRSNSQKVMMNSYSNLSHNIRNNKIISILFSNKNKQQQQLLLPSSLIRSKMSTSTTASTNKTPGDYFLDNLGNIFLSAIALIIFALVRSSKSSSNKLELRSYLEKITPLDPFEIQDLQIMNIQSQNGDGGNSPRSLLDFDTMMHLLHTLKPFIIMEQQQIYNASKGSNDENFDNQDTLLSYPDFISLILKTLKTKYNLEPDDTSHHIQFGHLLDRVILQSVNLTSSSLPSTSTSDITTTDTTTPTPFTPSLGIVALSLASSMTPSERVTFLYQVMLTMKNSSINSSTTDNDDTISTSNSNTNNKTSDEQMIQLISYLQRTSQLVPDAQIIESTQKFPYQKYKIGTAMELFTRGKDEVVKSKSATSTKRTTSPADGRSSSSKEEEVMDLQNGLWSCTDFYRLLQSKNVCAWGECYKLKRD